jgi:hypothetical protein
VIASKTNFIRIVRPKPFDSYTRQKSAKRKQNNNVSIFRFEAASCLQVSRVLAVDLDATSQTFCEHRKNDTLGLQMRKLILSWLAIAVSSCALLGGCRPPPLLSYPWFWDFTKTKPKETDLVGAYIILKLRLPSDLRFAGQVRDAAIVLKTDHTAVLTEVPEFDDSGQKLVCRLSGTARWELNGQPGGASGWSVTFRDYLPAADPTEGECKLQNSLSSIPILSRRAPYRLYAIVGDADDGTGIEFEKTGHR